MVKPPCFPGGWRCSAGSFGEGQGTMRFVTQFSWSIPTFHGTIVFFKWGNPKQIDMLNGISELFMENTEHLFEEINQRRYPWNQKRPESRLYHQNKC